MTALPDGWDRRPLGEVAETLLGKMLDKGRPQGLAHVPYLRNVNVQWGRIDVNDLRTMELAEDEHERFGVRTGDLLVCEGGEIGRAAIWPGRTEYIAYQKALHRIRPLGDVESRFLLHFFSFAAQTGSLDALATGSTIKHLPQQQLRRLMVPIPPLDEQRRIVDILEDHLSHLDAADAYIDVSLRRLDHLRIAALAAGRRTALAYGRTTRVHDVADTSLGKMLDSKKTMGSSTRYLRNINVRWGAFDLDGVSTVPLSDSERTRLALRPGDVMVCEGGEPGRCAVWPGSDELMTFQKALHRIRPHDLAILDPHFLAVMLEDFVRSGRAENLFTGTTIKHLPQEKLREIEIPLPDLAVQVAVLTRIARVDEASRALRQDLERERRRSSTLRRAVLFAAFSGRLTGRSSDLEIAQELAG